MSGIGGHDRFDLRHRGEVDLHHAAAAVGHQEVVLAALGVDHHVERPIAIAQLGHGGALHLRPVEQPGERHLHQRRAGVGGEDVRHLPDVERW